MQVSVQVTEGAYLADPLPEDEEGVCWFRFILGVCLSFVVFPCSATSGGWGGFAWEGPQKPSPRSPNTKKKNLSAAF